MSSLFTAFVSSLHRFRDCLRLPALVVPFGMSKNEFSSLLFLVSSLRPLLAVFCLLLCNRHSSFCLRAFIIVFTHFVFRPLCDCFITRILLCNFFFCVKYFASFWSHFLKSALVHMAEPVLLIISLS